MQLHMFWALFIHAQDAQDIADDPEKQAEVWADLTRLRELFWETPVPRGPDLAPARADAGEVPARLLHARQLRRALVAEGVRLHRATGTSTPTSRARTRPAGTTASPTPTPSTSRRWRRRTRRRSGWSSARGATSGCAATRRYTLDVDFGEDSTWGVQRYFAEQLAFFDRWLKEDGAAPADEAPVRIFVMGGGSGRKTALGKLDHGGRWREEHEWPLARAQETVYHLRADGSLALEAPAGEEEPRRYVYDPAHPVPTIGGNYCSVGELPAEGAGMEPAWSRFLSPVLRLRNILTPGPADQKETPEFFAAREPYPRLSERADVLVYETEPLEEPVEVTGRARVDLARLVERRRHRLHREARGRPPAERGLSGRLRHADQRLAHPLPLPRGLRAGGAHGAGRGGARSRSSCRRRATSSTAATGSGSTSRPRTSRGST